MNWTKNTFKMTAFLFLAGCGTKEFGTTPVDFAVIPPDSAVEFSSDQADILPQEAPPAPTGPVCSEDLNQLSSQSNIKIAFAVDMSGSNKGGTDPGSDPDKSFRSGKIQEFFSDHKSANWGWQFIGFGVEKVPAVAFITDGGQADFTSDINRVNGAFDKFLATPDTGSTPFRAALNALASSIKNDIAKSPSSKSVYAILFLTDGKPSDYCDSNMKGCTSSNPDRAAIETDVRKLVSIAEGRITFNTIYYGPSDEGAALTLKNMAAAGRGTFIDTNESTRNIHLDQALKVQKPCP